MAKVVQTEVEYPVARPWQIWLRTVLIGLAFGLVSWILTVLLTNYVIEPLACRQIANAATNCVNATGLAGNVAAIMSALLAILVLVRLRIAQPIVITVGTAAILWSLATWTTGLAWFEVIAWSILLYGLCYALFAWITRYPRLVVSAIIATVAILIIRIGLVLSTSA